MVLGHGAQNPELKKCAIFCTVLPNFVHLRITPRIVVQSCCDKSDLGFVVPTFRWASASIRNANLKVGATTPARQPVQTHGTFEARDLLQKPAHKSAARQEGQKASFRKEPKCPGPLPEIL